MRKRQESSALKHFPKSKITELYIRRISDPTAKTQRAHDLTDMFQLRAKTEDGSDTLLSETVGTQNLQLLENAKASFLQSMET